MKFGKEKKKTAETFLSLGVVWPDKLCVWYNITWGRLLVLTA